MPGQKPRLLLTPDTPITCPHCEREFPLADGFAKQALETAQDSSDGALALLRAEERQAADRQAAAIAREREAAHEQALAQVRKLAEETFQPQLLQLRAQLAERDVKLVALGQREAAVAARERSLETRVAELAAIRAAELVAGERQGYEERLAEREQQIQQLRADQLALREERQRLKDEKDALSLEVQRRVDAKLSERESLVRSQEQEKSGLEKAELHKTIEDMRAKLAEAQAKASQGSQQLQGEVLELAIEESLRRAFPLDTIEEVKKGVRGGDVIQRVLTRSGQAAGLLLWETKRAKDFSPAWIAKLKDDMRGCGAEIGVLVTMSSAIPKGWDSTQLFGLHEEVWVATWSSALQLAEVLRAGLLDVHKVRLTSAGKGEKMEAVYDYLTSPQFAQKLKAVYGAFRSLQEDLARERAAAEQRFARREKQIAMGVKELLGFAGDVQGLAQVEGSSLQLEHEDESGGKV
jgi:hypothetical protein